MKMPSDTLKIRDSIVFNKKVKRDFKLVCIGDIHLSSLVGKKDIYNISDALYREDPDYICIVGDIVDSPKELLKENKVKKLETLIKNSASIAPTSVILGSHDFVIEEKEEIKDVFDESEIWRSFDKYNNVSILNDDTYEDDKIFIGGYRQKKEVYYNLMDQGIEDSKAYYEDLSNQLKLIKNLPNDKPTIFLTHSPEPIQDKDNQELLKKYDMILTGHYHNSCVPSFLDNVWIPKNGGLITPRKKIFPKEARGIVQLETGSYLVYNGGWVKIQECAPKILQPLDKICNRQMDAITFTSDSESNSEIKISSRKKKLKI